MRDDQLTTDPEEARREAAAWAAAAVPIREVILARRQGADDLVVFWLDATGRPDLADLPRIHVTDGAGAFFVRPCVFVQRTPLRFQVGLDIRLREPATCNYKLLFDYYPNREWVLQMLRTRTFGIETGEPDKLGHAPLEGYFTTWILEHDVVLQLVEHMMMIQTAIDEVRRTQPDMMKQRYRSRPLFHGQVWQAREVPGREPPPRVRRGKPSNPTNN